MVHRPLPLLPNATLSMFDWFGGGARTHQPRPLRSQLPLGQSFAHDPAEFNEKLNLTMSSVSTPNAMLAARATTSLQAMYLPQGSTSLVHLLRFERLDEEFRS